MATGVNNEQLGKVLGLSQFVQQCRVVRIGEGRRDLLCQFLQVVPLFTCPAVQQLHASLGNGLEGLLDHRVAGAVKAACPAHAEFTGFAQPGQPALFTRRQRHGTA
ncbi:hypothetical protein D9M71_463070 [compost metagenome]